MPQTTETTGTSSLQDFAFTEDTEFFGIKNTDSNSDETVIKEIKNADKIVNDDEEKTVVEQTTDVGSKKDTSKVDKNKKEKEKEEEEPEFFQDESKDKVKDKSKEEIEDTSRDKTKDKGKETEEDDDFFTTLASELKEKGILASADIKDGDKVTEEQFFQLQEKEIESRVEETFEAFFEEMDEDGKAFLKFKKDGGKTSDFFSAFSESINITDFDPKNEAQRDKVITHYLATVEELDDTEIADKKLWLKEGGKEEAYAIKYFEKIEKQKQEDIKELAKVQEKAAKKREEAREDFNSNLQTVLSKTEEVNGFPISKEDQKRLGTFMIKPTIKVDKNKYIPAFQAKLATIFKAEDEVSKKNLILLAKLVESDFDFSEVATKKKTEVVKEAKSKLQESKANGGIKSSSSGATTKSLADFIDE